MRKINNIENLNRGVNKTEIHTIITFRNQQLLDLWVNEMSGQISDGMWENSRNTEWLWRNVFLRLGEETKVESIAPIGRRSFGMSSELWSVIGDRILDENGFEIDAATKVYFVKADGTKDTAILKSGDTVAKDSVYNYAITDGKFDVIEKVDAASTTALDNTRVLVVDKDNSYLATASTKYVFVNVDEENAKVTISTVTGYANAKVSAASIYAIADNNGRAVTVFVDGTPAGVEAAGLYAFLLDAVATETVENEKTVYTFDVFGGTVKTNSKTVADQIAALKAGARFSYKLTDGYVTEVTKVDANKTGEVKAVVEGDYFVVGTSALPFASDVVVYVNGDTFAAGTAADVVKGATVSVWTNSKDEASIIVVTPAAE